MKCTLTRASRMCAGKAVQHPQGLWDVNRGCWSHFCWICANSHYLTLSEFRHVLWLYTTADMSFVISLSLMPTIKLNPLSTPPITELNGRWKPAQASKSISAHSSWMYLQRVGIILSSHASDPSCKAQLENNHRLNLPLWQFTAGERNDLYLQGGG